MGGNLLYYSYHCCDLWIHRNSCERNLYCKGPILYFRCSVCFDFNLWSKTFWKIRNVCDVINANV